MTARYVSILGVTLIAAVLSLPTATFAQDPGPRKLAVKTAPITVGQVREDASTREREGKVKTLFEGKSVTDYDHSQQDIVKTRRTVLATEGDRVTKMKIEYVEEKYRYRRNDKIKDEDESKGEYDGKSFIVELKGKDAVVTNGDGAAADPKIAPLIAKAETSRYGLFDDRFTTLLAFIAKTPAAMDDEIQLPKDVVRDLFLGDPTNEAKIDSATLMLSGIPKITDVQCAEYDVNVVYTEKYASGGSMTGNFSGGVVVAVKTGQMMRFYGTSKYTMKTETTEGAITFSTEEIGKHKDTIIRKTETAK